VPGNGTASVSVTIPAGTANGAHTVYAIGDQGDTAGAPLTVAVPTTISTSVWDVRDASTGTESNQSEPHAFANDSRTATSGSLLSFRPGSTSRVPSSTSTTRRQVPASPSASTSRCAASRPAT
jgi:hypothetical protein